MRFFVELNGQQIELVPAKPVMVTVEPPALPAPKKRGRPRKTTAVVAEPIIAEPVVAEPVDSTQRKRKPRIIVPLNECKGLLLYRGKKGEFMCAIYKTGTNKQGKPWYLLLFVSKDEKWAYTMDKPFFASADKIVAIEWFN